MQRCLGIILLVATCLGFYFFLLSDVTSLVHGYGPADAGYMRRYNQMFDMVHNEIIPQLKVVECPALIRRNISLIQEERLKGNWFMIALTPPFGAGRRHQKNKCLETKLPRIIARTAMEEHVISSDNSDYIVIYRCDEHDDLFLMNFRIFTRTKAPSSTIYKNSLEVLRVNNISETVMVQVLSDRATCTNFV